jgi:hypothetical protein
VPDDVPDGYAAWWLDKNMAEHDPVCRAARIRLPLPPSLRETWSHKCWDSQCIHYIYGFPSQDERDLHTREHPFPRRDGNLSFGSSPALPFPELPSRAYGGDHSRQSSAYQLPKPVATAQPTPLGITVQPRDLKDTIPTFSFPSEVPATSRQHRGSMDSEVDPLLPPLKPSRMGKSRLQSIGELRLLKDVGPCLRCTVLNREVCGLGPHKTAAPTVLTDNSATRRMQPVHFAPTDLSKQKIFGVH